MPIRPHAHPHTGLKGYIVDVSRVIDGRLVRRHKVVYGSKRAAEEIEARMRVDLASEEAGLGKRKSKAQPTLARLVESFLEYSRLAHRASETNVHRAKPVLRFFGERKVAASIRQQDVIEYLAWRRKQKTPAGKRIAPATADRELEFLRRVFDHAIVNGLLSEPKNPAAYVKKARLDNRRDRVLSDEELLALLAHAAPFHRRVILAARFTGLRKSHLLALAWEQIEGGVIRPPAFDPDRLYASSKRFGVPPIPDGLFEKPARRQGPVFCWRGRPVKNIRHAFEAAARDAGIEGVVFHDLRRTYATHLRRLKVDPFVAMTILGHAPDRTLQVHHRYQVVSLDEILAVGRLLTADDSYRAALAHCKSIANDPSVRHYADSRVRRKSP